jgi:hypothetical protein
MVRAGIKEAHPAGIWSDMTSDGPIIGTLVVVLDRAVRTHAPSFSSSSFPYLA